MAAAACATSPNRSVRPLGRWVMVLFSARHSRAGTSQRAAAAATSISRAVAPAWRKVCCDAATERLALVDMSPQTRWRLRFSDGEANSGLTLPQSHSSSSATSMGSAVKMPWPISERLTRMTTVSSGSIMIQALTSGASSAARAGSPAAGQPKAEHQAAAAGGRAEPERNAGSTGPPRSCFGAPRSIVRRGPPHKLSARIASRRADSCPAGNRNRSVPFLISHRLVPECKKPRRLAGFFAMSGIGKGTCEARNPQAEILPSSSLGSRST